ncbi:protein maelstrom homolog [Periplaneta americana]|uniref:protein maelstrom homolog n=1 Tax=Periplaneta americana TaxID=6978 RepID=UPI0037E81BD2
MLQVKKKKQPKNAFYFFMVHYKRQQEDKGVRFRGGMKEVAEKAAPLWKDLPTTQRWIYEEEARREKERDKIDLENKFTTQGKSYAELERERNEVIGQQMKMVQEIEGTVRKLDYNTVLPTYTFYLIHVNYYCRQENGNYTPCEIALAEFNFADGVRRTYHTLINPGSIPLGYKFEADKHSAESHQIPVPPEEFGGETNYIKILEHVKLFLTEATGDGSFLPPLYTQPNCEDAVKNVLWRLQESVADFRSETEMFRVYPLPKLFFELRNACVSKPGGVGFPAFSLAERELERDVFNFTRGISCDFHEETDALPYCSLSCVRRWAFLILDHCCKDLGIDLVPGSHCPKQADTSRYQKLSSRPSSVAGDIPQCSSNPWMKPRIVDHGKLPPDPQSGQLFTLGAMPGVVTVSKKAEPRKEAAPQESLAPLRLPKTQSVALSVMRAPELTEENFPAIGSSKNKVPTGVMNSDPIVVTGRGKMAARLANPISLGRGRSLTPKLETDVGNLKLD